MSFLRSFKLWKVGAFAMGVCLVAVIVMVPLIARAASDSTDNTGDKAVVQRSVTVSGSADVMVAPDEVQITVGVETRHAEFKKALSDNDVNVKTVLSLTKKYGIDPKNVQSDYIRTFPNYIYEQYNETTKISYYTVQKQIVIKLKDITKFDSFISDMMTAGGIQVQNIEFRSTEMTKYRNEARKLAVKAAKDKAILFVTELDSNVGRPITINEEQVESNAWYGSWWGSSWYGGGQNMPYFSNVVSNYQTGPVNGAGGQDGETIAIGQIKVTAKVGVVFEIK